LLGKQQICEILTTWAEQACNPSYNEIDFEKDFERLYLAGGLNYSSELAKHFGYIDFDAQIQLHRDNKIPISNTVFQSLDIIDGNVLRAYLAVKILNHGNRGDENDVPVTINSIADLTGMSIPTLKRVLPVAKKMKLLYIEQGAKRKGEPNTYHCNHINDSDVGFKALSVNDLDVYLSTSKRLKLSNNELKVYLFMLYKFYTKDRAMSLKKIAKFVGLTESAVSKIVKSLNTKRYLKIERVYKDNVVFFNKYTLLK
jgi:DNA-binding MarR family transcriptional regulator